MGCLLQLLHGTRLRILVTYVAIIFGCNSRRSANFSSTEMAVDWILELACPSNIKSDGMAGPVASQSLTTHLRYL